MKWDRVALSNTALALIFLACVPFSLTVLWFNKVPGENQKILEYNRSVIEDIYREIHITRIEGVDDRYRKRDHNAFKKQLKRDNPDLVIE